MERMSKAHKQMKIRPRELLQDMSIKYHNVFTVIEEYRHKEKSRWPEWCYVPTGVIGKILEMCGHERDTKAIGMVAFLSAWRATKGIYRFDPDVYEAVRNTPVKGDLPCDIFYQMPEWGIYIETHDLVSQHGEVHGCFAYMDIRLGSDRGDTLNFLLDIDNGMIPMAIEMKQQTVDAAMTMLLDSFDGREQDCEQEINAFKQVISLLIYLCSSTVEYVDAPRKPKTRKGKKDWVPPRVTMLDVGVRMGTAIRHYREVSRAQTGSLKAFGEVTPVAPHIRRAHYHHFWRGPKDDRELIVKWLPPIPVNVDGDLPVTIRAVKT